MMKITMMKIQNQTMCLLIKAQLLKNVFKVEEG